MRLVDARESRSDDYTGREVGMCESPGLAAMSGQEMLGTEREQRAAIEKERDRERTRQALQETVPMVASSVVASVGIGD